MEVISLRPNAQDAVGINAVAHFAQVAQTGAPHHEAIARAQMAQIENRLRGRYKPRGIVRGESDTLQKRLERQARRDHRFGKENQLLLHAMSFFPRWRRLGHDCEIGRGAAEIIHGDDARCSCGQKQNAD